MIVLEDTRNQAEKHKLKHDWFIKNGIHVNRAMLICGDYQLPAKGDVAVDTKFSIQELIGDIQVKQMAKRDILSKLDELSCEFKIPKSMTDDIFNLITSDDSERFVEKEIADYCFKNNISESVEKEFQQLYVKRHGFFHRGLLRAKNYGVKLYILVDNNDGVTDINSLFSWVNPRRRIMVNTSQQIGYWKNGKPRYKRVPKYPNCMMGQQLAKACITMQNKYGCEFVFCRPEEAGKKIVELLIGEVR